MFDDEPISGWAAEEPLDGHHRNLLLNRVHKGDPGLYLYDMIQLSGCGQHPTRVWQWIRGGRCVMRTRVDEQRITNPDPED